jgi:hypothetical protein
MLADYWARIASPAIEPFVRSLAEGSGPMRDAALERVLELNPDAGRKIALDRIRRGDVMETSNGSYRVLLSLPDATLPEMDGPLVDALLQGKKVESLIARYATEAVRERLEALPPGQICREPMLAYFFRVDPGFAESTMARLRQHTNCNIDLWQGADLLASPGLEHQALEDVHSSNQTMRNSALVFLLRGGSPTAEQPLMDAFLALQANSAKIPIQGSESGFLSALLNGRGWVPTPEMVDGITAACATDSCRASAATYAR